MIWVALLPCLSDMAQAALALRQYMQGVCQEFGLRGGLTGKLKVGLYPGDADLDAGAVGAVFLPIHMLQSGALSPSTKGFPILQKRPKAPHPRTS